MAIVSVKRGIEIIKSKNELICIKLKNIETLKKN